MVGMIFGVEARHSRMNVAETLYLCLHLSVESVKSTLNETKHVSLKTTVLFLSKFNCGYGLVVNWLHNCKNSYYKVTKSDYKQVSL